MTTNDPELTVRMAQAGIGMAFVSKWCVFRAVQEGSVKVLPTAGRKLTRKFYLMRVGEEPGSAAVRAFRDFITGYRFFMPF